MNYMAFLQLQKAIKLNCAMEYCSGLFCFVLVGRKAEARSGGGLRVNHLPKKILFGEGRVTHIHV